MYTVPPNRWRNKEDMNMIGYAIYFTWKDGTEDSFTEYGASRRNMAINNLLHRENLDGEKEFIKISYCRIYKSGEYGKRITVR